jgi:hypothetical protein
MSGWRMIASCPSLTKFTFGLSHKTVLRWLFCSGLGVIEIIVSAHTSFIILLDRQSGIRLVNAHFVRRMTVII